MKSQRRIHVARRSGLRSQGIVDLKVNSSQLSSLSNSLELHEKTVGHGAYPQNNDDSY